MRNPKMVLLISLMGCIAAAQAAEQAPSAPPKCTAPAYKTYVLPEYPRQPVWSGMPQSGTVYLTLHVNDDGTVGVVTLDPTKRTAAHADLQHAAMAAAKKWTFSPPVCDGKPTAFVINVAVPVRPGDN